MTLRLAVAVGLLAWPMASAAQDWMRPVQDDEPLLVTWARSEGVYYALPAGGTLTWHTDPPTTLLVSARQRLSGTDDPQGRVELLGDGVKFLTIDVTPDPLTGALVFDEYGGAVSIEAQARVEVPEGGSALGVHAPADGPAFLVRVSDGTVAPERVPRRERPRRQIDAATPGLSLGPVLGGGVPLHGDTAVGFAGAELRLPLGTTSWSAGLRAGWFRFGVDRDLDVVDPQAGAFRTNFAWRYSAVPVSAQALWAPTFPGGRFGPVLGAGCSLALVTRDEEGARRSGVSAGLEARAGLHAPLGPALLEVAGAWQLLHHDFGNLDPQGGSAHESLDTLRLDAAWLFRI